MFPESPSPSTQHATKMLQGLVSFPDQFQTDNGSGLLSPWHHLVHVLLLCTWTSYLFAKWQMCLSSNSSSLWVAWIFEMLLALPDLFSVCEFTLFLFAPPTPRPSLEDRLEEKPVETLDPTVHVLITTCGESTEVVMETILAAANQTYDKTSFRVFVLDDGRTESLRKAVEDLNSNIDSGTIGLRPVVYLARDKDSGLTNYKSGNLRFGLECTLAYGGGSQYVAALDADMVPERDWLARTVLPLQEDSNVAMAGPPQHFRNVPADDLLGQDTGAFREIFEPLRDRFGFSQCCGSGYVVRREALDSIGGWPLCNVGEDIVCSCTLMEAGWKTAYVNAELQCGVVADSFHAYVAQRVRWTIGTFIIGKRFRFFLPFTGQAKKGTVVGRCIGFFHAVKPYMHAVASLPMLAMPVCLFASQTGGAQIDNGSCRLQFACLWVVSKLWKRVFYQRIGRRNAINMFRNHIWLAPYHIYSILIGLTRGPEKAQFVVSGTFKAPLNERSAHNQRSLFRRMVDPLVAMHSIHGLVTVALLSRCVFHRFFCVGGENPYWQAGVVIRLVEVVFAAFVPVRYMIWPPVASQPTKELAEGGLETGAGKRYWKRRDGAFLSWQDVVEILVITSYDWW